MDRLMQAVPSGAAARLICLVIGYAAGNLLTAEIVARIAAGKAPAEIGSGNPGMANIMANVGKKAGFAVLAGDLAKTWLACLAGYYLAGETGICWAGLGAVLGHNYPVWKRGRGGKGVAVTCAWLAAWPFPWGILCVVLGGVVTLITGYLPVGAVVIPAAAIPFGFLFGTAEQGILLILALVLMLLRHRDGLARVMQGKEQKKLRRKHRSPDEK